MTTTYNPMSPNVANDATIKFLAATSDDILKFGQTIICEAPATCGEFVRGFIGGREFLINCPIDLYARASVRRSAKPGLHVKDPLQHIQIQKALAWMESPQIKGLGFEVTISKSTNSHDSISIGSAELTAAIGAMSIAIGQKLKWAAFPEVIAHIKPNDNMHRTGISELNVQTGECLFNFPAPTDLNVIVVDCVQTCADISVNTEKEHALYQREQANIVAAVSLMRNGLRRNDLWAISDAATSSAFISQRIMPNFVFNELLTVSLEAGALGLNCTHRGTICGILYRRSDYIGPNICKLIEARFGSAVKVLGDHRVVSGGCRTIESALPV